ncbi:MAG: peptidoglycan-binding protein [Clostridia bacterium]
MKRIFVVMIMIFSLIGTPTFAQATQDEPSAHYKSLSAGSKGKAVTALQEQLVELGLTNAKADGIYGKQTTAAVSQAQFLLNAAGYQVASDGSADAKTQALLFDDSARDALTTLRAGCKSERVKQLQLRLIDLNLLDDNADGAYGSNTAKAVQTFQETMSRLQGSAIPANGIADAATQALLNEDLSAYGFKAPIYFDSADPLSLTADYLYANSSILIDAPTGTVLFEDNADAQSFPASTTKLMTLLLAVEQGNLDKLVTIPASAADVPKDSSLVPVFQGEQMPMIDLLYGMMIRSGNDAANAVAELYAGSVDAFVSRMNERAAQLGMQGTHFVNPHGYHDDSHYSTARDLAILAREGLTKEAFGRVITCLSYTLPPTSLRNPLQVENKYEIFDSASPYYIQGISGGKSGYTSLAGFCYVGVAQQQDKTLIAVVLGAPSRSRAWLDLQKLFAYGFAR